MKSWFYLSITAFAFACNYESSEVISEENFEISEEIQENTEGRSFFTTIDAGILKLKVSGIDHPTAQEMVVHTSDGQMVVGEIRRTVKGKIENAFTGDLNNDGYPELYVLSKESADSTAIMAFQLMNDRYAEIEFPEKPADTTSTFEILNNKIVETITNKNGDTEKLMFSLSPSGILIQEKG